MAIVDMKRMSLIAPQQDEQALLDQIQRMACIHLTPADEDDGFARRRTPAELGALEETMTRVRWAAERLMKYDTAKKPFLSGKPTVTTDEALRLLETRKPALMQTVDKLEELERESGELRGRASRIQATKEQLSPWRELPLAVREIASTKNTVAFLGTAQKSALEALLAQGGLPELCEVRVVSFVRELAYFYAAAHKEAAEETLARLREAGYAPVNLGAEEGTVEDWLAALANEEAQIEARQAALIQETASYAGDTADMKTLYDCLASQKERLSASETLLNSQSTFFLRGWIPEPMIPKAEKRLKKASPSACMEFTDPEEGEEPPVLLHNGPVVGPYESIVSGFSLPAYTGIDPTAVMMPFFANFMGMMVSDAGYGLLMVILIPILIKACKPGPGTRRLMWILVGGGVATVVWGALYNTWFGFAPWPSVFDPVNNALPVMGVCVALGAVHLFAGLGMAAYLNIRRGKPLSAIADQLSWFLLVMGLIIMVLPIFIPGISSGLATVGQWSAIAGAGIILVTAGREKSKNPLKRLLSGLGALYGATSWVSDLLSYMRLFGMGLATGVIGMVFNQLVGMIFAAGPALYILAVPLFVFCHLFNAGINILGAYVHSCRLQYIEFFGKFYEDGGKPFTPLAAAGRYCSIGELPEHS